MNRSLQRKNYQWVLAAVVFVCLLTAFSSGNAISRDDRHYSVMVRTIKCYPNPATSFVNFEFPSNYISKGYTLSIFSFTGKKMNENNVTGAKLTLTFSDDYFRGIYIFQLRDKSGRIIETGKFQVVK